MGSCVSKGQLPVKNEDSAVPVQNSKIKSGKSEAAKSSLDTPMEKTKVYKEAKEAHDKRVAMESQALNTMASETDRFREAFLKKNGGKHRTRKKKN